MTVRLYLVIKGDIIQFPVNPPEVKVKTPTDNMSVDLVKLGEVNVLKKPKLTELGFDCFFPPVVAPYRTVAPYIEVEYVENPEYYVNLITSAKNAMDPVQFIISNFYSSGYAFNEFVSIEDFDHTLTAWGEVAYSINFKVYQPYGAKILNANGKIVSTTRVMNKKIAPTVIVKPGDTLIKISRTHLGTGQGVSAIAKLNNIKNSAAQLAQGTILKIPGSGKVLSGLNTSANFIGINPGKLTIGQVFSMAQNGVNVPKLVEMKALSIKSRAFSNISVMPSSSLSKINLPTFINKAKAGTI